jgi:hypothetical protein
MSKQVIKCIRCDGCGKDTWSDSIEIAVSRSKYTFDASPDLEDTTDLCVECYRERGLFICEYCHRVHSADTSEPCEEYQCLAR